jgi:PAS domain S-box-containing protein
MDQDLQAKLAVLTSVNHALLASQARYEALLDLLPVGVTILSASGVIQYVNRHVLQITGLPLEQIIGRPFDYSDWNVSDSNQSPITQDDHAFIKMVTSKTPFYNLEYCITAQPGHLIFISVSGMPLLDDSGAVKEVVLVTQDITDQKEAACQTEAARAKQAELLQWQNRLLAIIGHDLRNPLSIISTSADFLELTDQKELPPSRQRRYKNIQSQTKRLANMLRNVDSVYRGQVGKLRLELSNTDLPALLQQVLDDLTERYLLCCKAQRDKASAKKEALQ